MATKQRTEFESYYGKVWVSRGDDGVAPLSSFIADAPRCAVSIEIMAEELKLNGNVSRVATGIRSALRTSSPFRNAHSAAKVLGCAIVLTAIEFEHDRTGNDSLIRSPEELVEILTPRGTSINTLRGHWLREDWRDKTEARQAIWREAMYLRRCLGLKQVSIDPLLYAKRNAERIINMDRVISAAPEQRAALLIEANGILGVFKRSGYQFFGGTASKAAAAIWVAAEMLGLSNSIDKKRLCAAGNFGITQLGLNVSALRKAAHSNDVEKA